MEEPTRTLWVLVKGGLSPVKIKNAEKLDVYDLLQKLKERTRRELISLESQTILLKMCWWKIWVAMAGL